MGLVYFVGVVYPSPARAALLPDSYKLNVSQLEQVRKSLIGCPITYDHSAIMHVLDIIKNFDLGLDYGTIVDLMDVVGVREGLHHCSFGEVTDSFFSLDGALWVTFSIDSSSYPGIVNMVAQRLLDGLSLTHLNLSQPVPMEVTLCAEPARPGCRVSNITQDRSELNIYKIIVMLQGMKPGDSVG